MTEGVNGDVLRIANCSGFYGDRLSAAREMVDGGPIDVLTGDYLAELTMLILYKARQRDHALGYASTFYRQMEDVLGDLRGARHQGGGQRRAASIRRDWPRRYVLWPPSSASTPLSPM